MLDQDQPSADELVQVLDRATAERLMEDGRYRMRCRVPFRLNASFNQLRANRTIPEPGDDAAREIADSGSGTELITGIASSTSVDWYGTHMTREALDMMAEQFKRGVDYFPRHHGFLSAVEWYEVIGKSVDARVIRREVKEPAESAKGTREQFVLEVDIALDMAEELAQKLWARVKAGVAPGQSIGGWFTDLAVRYDDDGEVVEIAVYGVELDHLAAVRSPANPDSDNIWAALSRCLTAAHPANDAPEVETIDSREAAGGAVAVYTPEPEGEDLPEAEPEVAESDDSTDVPEVVPTEEDEEPEPAPVDEEPEPEEAEVPEEDQPQPVQANAGGLGSDDQVMVERETEHPGAVPSAQPAPPNRRNEEIDMDPKQLAELIGQAVAEANAPLVERVERIERASAGVQPADEAARIREEIARRKAETAEMEARLAGHVAPAPAERQTRTATPAPAVNPADAREEMARAAADYHGLDIRTVAPNSARAIARSYGALDMTPEMVAKLDGVRALANMANADGTARQLSALVLEDHGTVKIRGVSHAVDMEDPEVLKYRSTSELENLLGEVLFRGLCDNLLSAPAQRVGAWS